jgi:integrative and conjugative element protein (TIGR02256 family)
MAKGSRRVLKEGRDRKSGTSLKSLHADAASAQKIVLSHPCVRSLPRLLAPLSNGGFKIGFDMRVSLPSRANSRRKSATGVRAWEPIVLMFPPAYPYLAPFILLRPDFNGNFPHIYPIAVSNQHRYIIPCIYDGPLDDLLHQEGDGLSAILDQLSDWLGKAAIDDLIDPKQGWESIRRDYIAGWMLYDVSRFEAYVQKGEGSCVFRCDAFRKSKHNEQVNHVWVADEKTLPVSPGLINSSFFYQTTPFGRLYSLLTVLVWSSSQSIMDQYLPDDVEDFGQLSIRAKAYGLAGPLSDVLAKICWAVHESTFNFNTFPIFVVLCVRRPYHLIGDESSLEFIPYLIECKRENRIGHLPGSIAMISADSRVVPLGHRHKVTKKVLRRMSGVKEAMGEGSIVHIGCGSVGSKIAMHLAKAGHEPHLLIDSAVFSPHNAARHACVPPPEIPGIPKAVLLTEEIRRMRLAAEPVIEDIVEIFKGQSSSFNPVRSNNRLVIESTGSIAVRDMLASLPPGRLVGRLLHAILYGQGRIGVMAIEGPERSPNVNDLVLRLYDECVSDPELAAVFSDKSSVRRQEIGQGCGSHTMVMPDTRVSLFSSGMAQRAMQILANNDGGPSKGELWIGRLTDDELGVLWKLIEVGPTVTLRLRMETPWEIRIPQMVARVMSEDMNKWGAIETGGVLMGRLSMYNRCFNIARLVEAPPDSTRTRNSFTLGVKGLKDNILKIHDASGGMLAYLGTWHSHPLGGDASEIDKNMIAQLRGLPFEAPALGLIVTPSGFRAIVDEGKLA